MRALVVDDDRALSALLQRQFSAEGYEVELAHDGETAISLITSNLFDLLILDLNLPGRDGLEVLTMARSSTPSIAIMVLTARASAEDRVRCYEQGADDYLTKPFGLRELTVRAKALSRRMHSKTEAVLRCGDLELNRLERSVVRSGKSIDLTAREYALVEFMLRNKGRSIARGTLLNQVWNMPEESTTNVVNVYVNYLRRKLDRGFSHSLIRTVRGGYVMGEPMTPTAAGAGRPACSHLGGAA